MARSYGRAVNEDYARYTGNEFLTDKKYKWVDFMSGAVSSGVAKPFDLTCPISRDWDDAEFRLLIVVEKVDSGDLKERSLLASQMGVVLTNLMRHTRDWAHRISGERVTPAVAAINFNCAKTYTIEDSSLRTEVEKKMAARVRKYINKVDPTHVLIIGDNAAYYLVGEQYKQYKYHRGSKLKVDYGTREQHIVPTVTTIDISDTYGASFDVDEDNDNESAIDFANILGYVSRTMLTLWLNYQPYTIRKVKPNYVLVDNMRDVKALVNRMWDAKIVALDVEARNLNKLDNKLLTLQVAFDSDTGYLIPLWHPDTPFSSKELKRIRTYIRDWLMDKVEWDPADPSYMIWHGGKYDLTQLRRDFGVPVIRRLVYDTMAGQHALDENVKALEKYGTPIGGLKNLCAHYNNMFYFRKSDFGKDDRANMESVRLDNEDFLKYGAFDVQSVFAIHEEQLKEADHLLYGDRVGYRTEMLRLVLFQIGPSIHVFSHMEHRGVPLDVDHLARMMLPNSPVSQALKEEEKIIYKSQAAINANSKLVKASGVPTKGMFGTVNVWQFDISKRAHQEMYFLKELKLKPLSYGVNGDPSFGKTFLAAYKDIPEVAAYSNLTKAKKLKSSYINAFYNRMDADPDSRIDQRLRPSYGFWGIVTGRSNSYDPSLQQIPQHNAYAKYIKRAFIARYGTLIVKMDYSAHEIRCIDLRMFVETIQGKIRLGELLTMKAPPLVKSFNHATEEIEYKPAAYQSIHTTDEPMVEIEYEGGSIRVTANHEVWSETRKCYIRADSIQEGEEVVLDGIV